MKTGWIAVDLDGTLAVYNRGDIHVNGPTYIGPPIPDMVERIKKWLLADIEVRIFTARVGSSHPGDIEEIRKAIETWCLEHIGQVLQITNVKDYDMIELWDDRAVQVIPNQGITLRELLEEHFEPGEDDRFDALYPNEHH